MHYVQYMCASIHVGLPLTVHHASYSLATTVHFPGLQGAEQAAASSESQMIAAGLEAAEARGRAQRLELELKRLREDYALLQQQHQGLALALQRHQGYGAGQGAGGTGGRRGAGAGAGAGAYLSSPRSVGSGSDQETNWGRDGRLRSRDVPSTRAREAAAVTSPRARPAPGAGAARAKDPRRSISGQGDSSRETRADALMRAGVGGAAGGQLPGARPSAREHTGSKGEVGASSARERERVRVVAAASSAVHRPLDRIIKELQERALAEIIQDE